MKGKMKTLISDRCEWGKGIVNYVVGLLLIAKAKDIACSLHVLPYYMCMTYHKGSVHIHIPMPHTFIKLKEVVL